jgi:hypothetical protein
MSQKFNKNIAINSNAINFNGNIEAQPTLSLALTHSYSGEKHAIDAYLYSYKEPWLVYQVSGSDLPTSTGWYDLSLIWASGSITGSNLIWGTAVLPWGNEPTAWGESAIRFDGEYIELDSDRAFIISSDEETLSQYDVNELIYKTY